MSTESAKYYTTTHPSIRYLSLSDTIPFSELLSLAHKIQQLFAYLASTEPPTTKAGPPFFRYVAIPVGMGASQPTDMEVGIPVPEGFSLSALSSSEGSPDASKFEVKTLPAGSYFETVHVGAPKTLMDATREYLQHADKEGVEFDVQKAKPGSLTKRDEGGDGKAETQVKDRWAARLEWYESDPEVVKDVNEWKTRLSYKLK